MVRGRDIAQVADDGSPPLKGAIGSTALSAPTDTAGST